MPSAPGGTRRRSMGSHNPCMTCVYGAYPKVQPYLPPRRKLTALGLAPGEIEEGTGIPFTGDSGQLLRAVLRAVGLDPAVDVGYANLARCRPINNDFADPNWPKAQKSCWPLLQGDLVDWLGPILLLGTEAIQRFFRDDKARIGRHRGLWYHLPDGREGFAANHPAAILRRRREDPLGAQVLFEQFVNDLRLMADRILGREKFQQVQVTVFRSPFEASKFFAGLARGQYGMKEYGGRWFFDIETFDAREVPSRKAVATDPFHPDFRVRGVSVAYAPNAGVWVEFPEEAEARKAEAAEIMTPAFVSDDEKGAHYGGFDENGLIVPGWVYDIRNRTRDPWLKSIALDASGGGHSLERLVVSVLKEPQPKGGIDRSMIAHLSLEKVAEYAVNDACSEFRLDLALSERLALGEYL